MYLADIIPKIIKRVVTEAHDHSLILPKFI